MKEKRIILEVLQRFLEKNIGRKKGDLLSRSEQEAKRLLDFKINNQPIVEVFKQDEVKKNTLRNQKKED